MPLSSKEVEEIHHLQNDLTLLYRRVKAYVIASEKLLGDELLSVPAINEFRNAFDHERRVAAVVHGVNFDGQKNSGLSELDYCKTNLNKAMAHIYRAGYDALEAIALSYIREIDRIADEVRRTTMIQVIPDYSERIVVRRNAAMQIHDHARANKDVETIDLSGQYFDKYEEAVETFKELADLLTVHLPELYAVDQERNKEFQPVSRGAKAAVWTLAITVVMLVIAIAGLYLSGEDRTPDDGKILSTDPPAAPTVELEEGASPP